jgi:Na+-translocating ferredoxin:NAD+ oxidoreductase subunit A
MSYVGIVITSVFASNALLAYGLGSVPGQHEEAGSQTLSALALALVNALASSLLWLLHSLVLSPLKLGSLDILFFALLAVPLLKFVAKAGARSGEGLLSRLASKADDLVVGSLVFGIALLAANSAYSFPEALVASAASGLGYWLATFILESIRERLELSDLPRPFKGAPAILISAGLIALALMGVDAAFVKGMAG